MSDLRVDAAFLNALSATVTTASAEMSFSGWQWRYAGGVLESDTVQAALAAGTGQQLLRAGLLEALLVETGAYPASAAEAFLASDARLAREAF
ncbi:hypothetical protein D6T64_03000 [Cryobacterium melibiosiphilum]|uniref:Uncharacterized protein n=1 Tax=Cryobacterium melibiosiphilum TaxID=995039 RepID=A0A3A5ML69_9MICO|nr:hypothetical protein [Cryobacterium melibiosiphilum]RJT90850.1 hypothetical protein D6T64_03000 [Cryobacterium melibiosiphilum]